MSDNNATAGRQGRAGEMPQEQDRLPEREADTPHEYEPGSDVEVDLTRMVSSARPADLQVPQDIVKLASYAMPTMLDMVRRNQVLPYMLVIKRVNDQRPSFEPIEEDLKTPSDLLAYMARRIANDGKGSQTPADGYGGLVPAMPITAYGCLFDERIPGFSARGASVEPDAEEDRVLTGLFGCAASPQGVAVRQRFKGRIFGGASLLGAPLITAGPPSLLNPGR